ncbi:LOW QUALITY PROTEIN: uncharacterized protein [Penaeus vannamei]|uniref:LOW QUALITY PROTEIN: uncharacterized protein n=1 Tax=Penaeus vannamei TaxID=6689 RepID=UPI00387F8F49
MQQQQQMQQRCLTPTTPTTPTSTMLTPVSVPSGQYPGSVGGGFMSPALAAAAYMASAYLATRPHAFNDVAAMTNLITLSQAAARIREFNLANMVSETLPRPLEPTPIDLSPTSKAAPQTPLTNGRAHKTTAHSGAGRQGHASTVTRSPSSKSSRVSAVASPARPAISSPTPEVTAITKLPSTSAGAATSSSSTRVRRRGEGRHPVRPAWSKLGGGNTNTVSITKRPASSSRIVAKSPANASVRQIPNPSFVRHQSGGQEQQQLCPRRPSSAAAASATSSASFVKAGINSSKARATGRAPRPLKDMGPLPDTPSSILKMEHLTRSLAARSLSLRSPPSARLFDSGDREGRR